MKRLMLTAAIAAMLLPAAAFADGKGDKGKGGHKHHKQHAAQVQHHDRGHAPKPQGRHDNGLHLGHQRRAWAKGERLPTSYLADRYYVEDYRDYRLAPPPSGMVWVQPYENTREFYLVQIATGLVSQIFGR